MNELIVYRAAPGERVEIKGSEIIKNWHKSKNDIWKVEIPNSFFGEFNSYREFISGDWFWSEPKNRKYRWGEIYLNGHWLTESSDKEEDGIYLEMMVSEKRFNQKRRLITSDILIPSIITQLPYCQIGGAPIQIDFDYFGKKRNLSNPFPGPIEIMKSGKY